MNHPISFGRLLVGLLLMSALLWACGSAVTAPTNTPAEPLATGPEQATGGEPTVPEPPQSNEPIVPEPNNVELRVADFDGTILTGTIADIPVFFGVGSLTNDSGQVLLINVVGSTDASVIDYFNNAKFYFEIREPVDLPVFNESEEQFPKLSNPELFKDTSAEYLLIDFDLAPETYKEYPKGTLLVIVDPIVRQNQYNNYGTRNPASDRVDVTITVSQNQVEGKLYLRCAAIVGQTKRASPGIPKTLTGIGAGNFDLTIKGINAGDNKYRITGAWNYDYNTAVLSELLSRITC